MNIPENGIELHGYHLSIRPSRKVGKDRTYVLILLEIAASLDPQANEIAWVTR